MLKNNGEESPESFNVPDVSLEDSGCSDIHHNNKQKSVEAMHRPVNKNSILGAGETPRMIELGPDPECLAMDVNMESECTENKSNNTRDHLKRGARDKRNSKYDESSYFVDFSGNRNKFHKNDELDLNMQSSCQSKRGFTSGNSSRGKI